MATNFSERLLDLATNMVNLSEEMTSHKKDQYLCMRGKELLSSASRVWLWGETLRKGDEINGMDYE